MNPNPDPQPESTVEPQKPLSEILDEIEQSANAATEGPWLPAGDSIVTEDHCIAVIETDGGYECEANKRFANQVFMVNARTDVPALVKALRHACERIGYFSDLYCGMNDMTGRNALEELTAILNQGRK